MTRAKDISKIITDADFSGTLDVAGELQVGVDGTTAGLIRLMDSGSVTEEATISTDANGGLIFGGNSGPGELIFKTSSGTERVRITSGGNVGIGTASPNISSVGKALTINTTSSVILELAKNGSRVANFFSDGTNASLTNNTNNALTFLTNNSEKMRITSLGNVGINTSSPASPSGFGNGGILHLKGSANNDCSIVLEGLYSSGGRQEIGVSTGDLYFNRGAATGSMSTSMIIKSTGNVGIGTTYAVGRLNVLAASNSEGVNVLGRSSDNRSRIQLKSNDGSTLYSQWDYSGTTVDFKVVSNIPLTFYTNSTERMRIDSSGNVGIGTSTIQSFAKLEIEGSAGAQTGANQALYIKAPSTTAGQGVGIRLSAASGSNEAVGIIGMVNNSSGTSGSMTFHTYNGGADVPERMRIDNLGNVGIGTSSPSVLLDLESTSPTIKLTDSDASGTPECEISGAGGDLILRADKDNEKASSLISFEVDGSERMRITSSGELLIGRTTGGSSSSLHLQGNGTLSVFQVADANSGTFRNAILFRNSSSGSVGSIQVNSTNVQYNTSSDHRLKEAVISDWDATTRLKQLNPVRFNFTANPDITVDGFLAHEVQLVVPEAISGTHNEVDADGNPVYQGIDQSKLVPLLVKTIQELEARITALETA